MVRPGHCHMQAIPEVVSGFSQVDRRQKCIHLSAVASSALVRQSPAPALRRAILNGHDAFSGLQCTPERAHEGSSDMFLHLNSTQSKSKPQPQSSFAAQPPRRFHRFVGLSPLTLFGHSLLRKANRLSLQFLVPSSFHENQLANALPPYA